jgi:CheY-like chemotaxis protein
VEGSLSRRRGGSGLGLTLSKQFVELHGGRLWVESDGIPNQGSKFWLTLPLDASPALAVTMRESTTVPLTAEERYFVVLDEDPVIAQLFERHTLKHRAISARTPDEAYRLLHEIYPSALVVDRESANVPEPISELAASSEIPVIHCSMPSGQRFMQSIGIANYLTKPVSSATLESILFSQQRPIQTILVVDDDPDMVRLYSHILQTLSSDYQVRKAYSGIEAMEIMRRSPPDLLILDLLMAGMSGIEVIAQMKANPALVSIPVVLTSAYDASEVVAPAAYGEIRLEKPQGFQPAELVRCVEALIDAITPSSNQVDVLLLGSVSSG